MLLAPSILVAGYAFIGASVRVHARNISATTPAGFEILLRQSNPSRRDPSDFSLPSTSDTVLPKITSGAPATVPGLVNLTTPLTQVQNPYLKVLIKSYAPASGATFPLWAILSVDLICRYSG